jgi:hypothetical protein
MSNSRSKDDDADEYDDGEPSAEEIASMKQATPLQVQGVDTLILSNCSTAWRKVAMVVGASLDQFDVKFPNLPYVFMQVRLLELEDSGIVEIQGDVMSMRASEVRLVSASREV